MALLHWVYENTENAGKAVQRIKDLKTVAEDENLQGLKLERIRLKGTRSGYNVNITLNDDRFNSYEDAQGFLRTKCIAIRKARREKEAAKAAGNLSED